MESVDCWPLANTSYPDNWGHVHVSNRPSRDVIVVLQPPPGLCMHRFDTASLALPVATAADQSRGNSDEANGCFGSFTAPSALVLVPHRTVDISSQLCHQQHYRTSALVYTEAVLLDFGHSAQG